MQTPSMTRPEHPAVLISGLRKRFIYQDSNTDYSGFDVFVVLQDTDSEHVSHWMGVPIAPPPYSGDVSTITAWLKKRGAAHVHVEIQQTERLERAVDAMVAKFGSKIRMNRNSNSKMLLMRHAVYMHALTHDSGYTRFP